MDELVMDSPIGFLTLKASDLGLTVVHISKSKPQLLENASRNKILTEARNQLMAYFNKQLNAFDIPLDFGKAPEFSKSVWTLLLNIPYGKTTSYGDLARQLGNINKSRAVGLANGSNPLAVIVPCHRVIGSNGTLTGYGGGLPAKEFLLKLENPSRLVQQGVLFQID